MKTILPLLFMLLLCTALSLSAAAQEKQPTSITQSDFEMILQKTVGQSVAIQMADGLLLQGTVISNEVKYECLQVCIVRSIEEPTMLLHISKRFDKDHATVYSGKLMTEQTVHFFSASAEGRVSLQSKPHTEVLQDCSFH